MKAKLTIIALTALLAAGCANTVKPMYDYADYSESFYAMKRDTGAESEAEWKSSLEEIITSAETKQLRVPPGVFANLGYLHLKANDEPKAISYFEMEMKTYPEATVFMTGLINKVKAKG